MPLSIPARSVAQRLVRSIQMLGSSLKDLASIRLIRKNQRRKQIQNPQLSQLQNQRVNPRVNRGAAAYPPLSLLLAVHQIRNHLMGQSHLGSLKESARS